MKKVVHSNKNLHLCLKFERKKMTALFTKKLEINTSPLPMPTKKTTYGITITTLVEVNLPVNQG